MRHNLETRDRVPPASAAREAAVAMLERQSRDDATAAAGLKADL
jgi:hypothetical protein